MPVRNEDLVCLDSEELFFLQSLVAASISLEDLYIIYISWMHIDVGTSMKPK